MTKMQSNGMRARQTIGVIMAKRAVIIDPTSSREEINTLRVPAPFGQRISSAR